MDTLHKFLLRTFATITGLIICGPFMCLSFITTLLILLCWAIPHFVMSMVATIITIRLEFFAKLIALVVIPPLVLIAIITALLVSTVCGFLYGLFGLLYHVITTEAPLADHFYEMGSNIYRYFVNIWELNYWYEELISDIVTEKHVDPDDVYVIYNYSILKFVCYAINLVIVSIANLVVLILMSIALYIPITIRSYYDGFAKLNCLLILVAPFIGILMLIFSPFYAVFVGIDAAICGYKHGGICMMYRQDYESVNDIWTDLINYVFGKKSAEEMPVIPYANY